MLDHIGSGAFRGKGKETRKREKRDGKGNELGKGKILVRLLLTSEMSGSGQFSAHVFVSVLWVPVGHVNSPNPKLKWV